MIRGSQRKFLYGAQSQIPQAQRAAQLLAFIEAYVAKTGGVPPSFTEMQGAAGVKSKSGVARLIRLLERGGKVRTLPGKARAMEIVKREAYFVWDTDTKALVPFTPGRTV